MDRRWKPNDVAYIVESALRVRRVFIKKLNGNLAVLIFEEGGGVQIPVSRLFATKEEAEASVKEQKEDHAGKPHWR